MQAWKVSELSERERLSNGVKKHFNHVQGRPKPWVIGFRDPSVLSSAQREGCQDIQLL